jgi:DNA-binding Xre family transcriptional regulator
MAEIRFNIAGVAENRGVLNPFQLAEKTGINYAICYRLWHGQATRISLQTLGRVCDALNCEPGDVLVRVETKGKKRGKSERAK